MRGYKVFRITKTGRSHDHHALFFETELDRGGTIIQVANNLGGGMRVERKLASPSDRSWDSLRKDHIGWVMEEKYNWVWPVVGTVLPPRRQQQHLPPAHRGPRTTVEWTEQVVRALELEGVMERASRRTRTVAMDDGRNKMGLCGADDAAETTQYVRVAEPEAAEESEVSEEE